MLLSKLVESYQLNLRGRIKPETCRSYRTFLSAFVEVFGAREAEAVKPYEVEDWAEGIDRWNTTSKHNALSHVQTMFRWALRQERILKNPLENLKKPRTRSRGREMLIDPEHHRLVCRMACPEFKDFLTALRETGARPSEVARVTAADFDEKKSIWLLTEHKTDQKSDRPRVIYLTPKMVELSVCLAKKNPTGPLFRNQIGRPWCGRAIHANLSRISRRLGIPKVNSYGYRHTFATEALANGMPEAQAAELLGHTSTQMLHKHYSHLLAKRELLLSAVNKVYSVAPDENDDHSADGSRSANGQTMGA